MNWRAVATIFNHEMARFYRTLWESLASPVMSTVLYFVVFGAAIGGIIYEGQLGSASGATGPDIRSAASCHA